MGWCGCAVPREGDRVAADPPPDHAIRASVSLPGWLCHAGQRPAIGWCQMTESRKSPRSGACMQGRHLPTPRRMLLASGNVLFSKPKIMIGAIPGRCISKPCRFPAKGKNFPCSMTKYSLPGRVGNFLINPLIMLHNIVGHSPRIPVRRELCPEMGSLLLAHSATNLPDISRYIQFPH